MPGAVLRLIAFRCRGGKGIIFKSALRGAGDNDAGIVHLDRFLAFSIRGRTT